MTIVQRILREKVLLAGVGTAVIGLLLVLGLDPTILGAIAVLVGAVTALLRAVLTPTSEVLVQQKPGEQPKATKALRGVRKGQHAWVGPADPAGGAPAPRGEAGTADLLVALVFVLFGLFGGVGLIAGWEIMLGLIVVVVLGLLAVRWYRAVARESVPG